MDQKQAGTMLDSATRSLGTIRVMSKVALMAGSSQQGKARRASVACDGKAPEMEGVGMRKPSGEGGGWSQREKGSE